jgi:AcrR family transcriptional regulator
MPDCYRAFMDADRATASGHGRVGRPPRISRTMIAEAAEQLGLEALTLRAVADFLDVSISSLYHHVSSKEELLRLAAEHSAAKVPLPDDRGQHWAEWLAEWGSYNHEIFVTEPGLLGQYIDGAISAGTIAPSLDLVIGVLVRQGFSPVEAYAAYELVSSCAVGLAVGTMREREAAKRGEGAMRQLRRVLAKRRGALPHLQAFLSEPAATRRRSFPAMLNTVLAGIAVTRGEDPDAVVAMAEKGYRRRN